MANEQNSRRQNNRQPSMRELANERMRKINEEKSASGQRRSSGSEGARRAQSGSSERPVQRRTSSENGERPSQRRSQSEYGERPVRSSAEREGARRPQSSSSDRPVRRVQSEGDERRRPSSDREQVRRSSSNSVSKRPAARDAIETERRTSRSSGSSRSSTKRTSSKQAPKKKGFPIFWIGLAAYTVILLALSFAFLKYTDVCLKKFEKSQSENYMSEYIKEFEAKVKDNTISPDDFTFAGLDLTFVDSNTLLNDYIESLKTHSSFTAEKDPTSYNTEAPVYNVFADGELVAKITLKAVSQTKIFAILTIMDWKVDTIQPATSIDLVNYTFLIPAGYTPVIDNLYVSDDYKTGNVEEIPEFEYVSKYVEMPEYVEYKVNNVLAESNLRVLNPAGEDVAIEKNGNKIRASYASPSAEVNEDRINEALTMVQTYEDFNTDDLSGPSHGLATVQSFLIKDSDFWNRAREWAGGVDITFTSAHVFDNPKYSNVVVDNYAEYSDKCYSLHIAFSKNMILTRTNEKRTNDFDSTVFFVYYDDSDDGVDNPHWCIADMIATTNNN